MNIGETAEASGISAKMIRHYESWSCGPIAVTHSIRIYSSNDLHFDFVRVRAQQAFLWTIMKQLLSLYEDRDRASSDVKPACII
jgi:DNA-binding transcriptional MerR regulator